jgi:hypothetical protein
VSRLIAKGEFAGVVQPTPRLVLIPEDAVIAWLASATKPTQQTTTI